MKKSKSGGVSRANREARIRDRLDAVVQRTGMQLQVVMALDGSTAYQTKPRKGYMLQRVEDGVARNLAGPLPGVTIEYYLDGMLVLLEVQRRDGLLD